MTRKQLRIMLEGRPELAVIRRRDAWRSAKTAAAGIKESIRRRPGDRAAAGGFVTWLPPRLLTATIAGRMIVYPTIAGPGTATVSVHPPRRDPRIAIYGVLAPAFCMLFVLLVWTGTVIGFDPLVALCLVVVAVFLVAFTVSLTDAARDRPLAVEQKRILATYPGLALVAEGLISAQDWDGYRLGRLLTSVADAERIAIIVIAIGDERIALYKRLGFAKEAERNLRRDCKCLLLRLPKVEGQP